jgi:hypothetical protein
MLAERSLYVVSRTLLITLFMLSAAALGHAQISESGPFNIFSCRCCHDGMLIVRPGSPYFLSGNESYGCVVVLPGAELYTGPHMLAVTCEDGLIVKKGSWLVIEDGGMLRLTANSDTNGHSVNGAVLLEGTSSELRIEQNTVLRGDGRVIGANQDAAISIPADKVLTNKIIIEGIGVVEGGFNFFLPNGLLRNEGAVVASGPGNLVLGSDLDLADTGSSLWKSDGGSATLLFLRNAGGLVGNFRADNWGVIEIDDGVTIQTDGDAHIDEASVMRLGDAAMVEVDDLTGEDGGLVIACGAVFAVNGTPPTGFMSPFRNEQFEFTGTNIGVPRNDCP